MPLMGKPDFIKKGVTLVAIDTINGLWITVNKKLALRKSAFDL
jgi:hypothetical protein